MLIEKRKRYAVLTGDIVGSSRLSATERARLHEILISSRKSVLERFGAGLVPMKPEIFRGDGWQFIVADSSKSLRVGLFFRASVRSGMRQKRIDTRVSIGIGTIDFLPRNNLSGGDGEAFRLSGEALEKLHKSHRMAVALPQSSASDMSAALDVIVKLIDLQAGNWTESQARAVSGALLGLKQEAIAKECFAKRITQQSVAQHLDRAGWNSIELGIAFFEEFVGVTHSTW